MSPGETLRPFSDTATRVCLYQRSSTIGGIAHTHSRCATSRAQACREIPCYGTTHADTFHGVVPLCRPLTAAEIDDAYEWNTGVSIAGHFGAGPLDPSHVPGVLLPFHAPFAWSATPAQAVEHAELLNPKAVHVGAAAPIVQTLRVVQTLPVRFDPGTTLARAAVGTNQI